MNAARVLEVYRKYLGRETSGILNGENCFCQYEVIGILLNGLNVAKDLRTRAIPWETPKRPERGSAIKFRYRENGNWRRASFIGTDFEEFPYELVNGDLYAPLWKKGMSELGSVYGKISAKLQNVLSDLF